MERSPIAALEPKQLDDEASRFHLGRQRQYSAVICSGALLFVVARFTTSWHQKSMVVSAEPFSHGTGTSKTPFRGWPVMAHETHMRRRRLNPLQCVSGFTTMHYINRLFTYLLRLLRSSVPTAQSSSKMLTDPQPPIAWCNTRSARWLVMA